MYLVTGCAGFIGSKTAELLLKDGKKVIGIDNLNDYYSIELKIYHLGCLSKYEGFKFYKADIENKGPLKNIFKKYKFKAVLNLAARAGVGYSVVNPQIYQATNILGTINLLELCRDFKVKKFLLASTSSVYSGQKMPFVETLSVNTPISPYSATKKAAEMLCYSYHYLFGIDVSILRYFTVYGPAGRPDMSVYKFIKLIDSGKPITLFGDGTQSRDFTYVDDIAKGTVKALKRLGFEVINLGGNKPYKMNNVIQLIERYLGKKARINRLSPHKSDIKDTWANIAKAKKLLKWKPEIGLETGIRNTIEWYKGNPGLIKKVDLV